MAAQFSRQLWTWPSDSISQVTPQNYPSSQNHLQSCLLCLNLSMSSPAEVRIKLNGHINLCRMMSRGWKDLEQINFRICLPSPLQAKPDWSCRCTLPGRAWCVLILNYVGPVTTASSEIKSTQ